MTNENNAVNVDEALAIPTVEIPYRGAIDMCQLVLKQRLGTDPWISGVEINHDHNVLVVRVKSGAPFPPKELILKVGNFRVVYWGE